MASEGLSGASLRAIAAEAGYTPAALYFHFESKEAIYGALLEASLSRLSGDIDKAVATAETPEEQLKAAAMAFFDHYASNPRDLDLGSYLFRDGMRPEGLGRARDTELNVAVERASRPISEAARELGADEKAACTAMADVFAHATGLLLLAHTQRIHIFRVSAREMMQTHAARLVAELNKEG